MEYLENNSGFTKFSEKSIEILSDLESELNKWKNKFGKKR